MSYSTRSKTGSTPRFVACDSLIPRLELTAFGPGNPRTLASSRHPSGPGADANPSLEKM